MGGEIPCRIGWKGSLAQPAHWSLYGILPPLHLMPRFVTVNSVQEEPFSSSCIMQQADCFLRKARSVLIMCALLQARIVCSGCRLNGLKWD